MKYNLNYVRLLTDNFSQLFSFYKDVLGLGPPRFNAESGPYEEFEIEGATLAIFDRNLMHMALDLPTDSINESSSGKIVIIFQVPDVDELYEKLKSKITFLTEPMERPDWRIKTVHIKDPDGNLIEFNQPM